MYVYIYIYIYTLTLYYFILYTMIETIHNIICVGAPRRRPPPPQRPGLGIHQRGVQSEGGEVDGGSIIE